MGFLNWVISTGEFETTFFLNSDTVRLNLILDSSLVAQVTFNNGSFINATVTIMRPINLNGGMIMCNNDMLTLNIPANAGKFLHNWLWKLKALEIESRGNLLLMGHSLFFFYARNHYKVNVIQQ